LLLNFTRAKHHAWLFFLSEANHKLLSFGEVDLCMKIWNLSLLCFLVAMFFYSCKKDTEIDGNVQLSIQYKVDNSLLLADTFAYQSPAGYQYKITKLEYFISNIQLKDISGKLQQLDTVFYVNALQSSTNSIVLPNIPTGKYTDLYFSIGLDSLHNISNSLSGSVEMENMAWPDMMGGGYHFLKLEGKYLNNGKEEGFAIHLGKNKNLVNVHLARTIEVMVNTNTTFPLTMNINEWLKNPETYDFVLDGSYSMSSDAAMHKLQKNGSDVFY